MLFALVATSGACGGNDPDDPTPTTSTADPGADQKQEVLDAFGAFWDEQVAIGRTGKVPQDAFADTAVGVIREDTIARLNQDIEHGTTREGEPEFKDQRVTVRGDDALVIACMNADDWRFVLKDGRKISADAGWVQLARKLTKVEDRWLVSDFADEYTQEECP